MLNRYTLIMTVATGLLLGGTAGAAAPASAAELARFEIREPLGIDWPGEWLSQRLELPDAALDDLRLLDEQGRALPARFTRDGRDVSVLFQAEIGANQTAAFRVVRRDDFERDWTPLRYDGQRVTSGLYELTFDERRPLPAIDGLPMTSHWPEGIEPLGVEDRWLERGPVRAVLERTFRFADPAHRYTITFDLRANDPWIAIVDDYALGRGSYLRVDLRGLEADRVFHHYAYNARTFSPGGDPENTTIQPPQHPIATLGPIWRDIWYNGGPFAFIYNTRADRGLGLATVRGSRWRAPDHVTLESQNLLVNGDREREGQVWVQVPTDAGRRHWAIVPGHADLRRQMPRMIRRHADIPLDTVLREWVLEWQSDAPQVSHGAAGVYLGSHFNRHFFNPTTYPRRVSRDIPASGPVKSRDLAVLAYLFTNPDYWPGPDYRWRIGNPNFHTDMYPIPFRIGLLMPEHPHAKRWVEHGVANLRHQIHHDSFPGGSWAESPGYSGRSSASPTTFRWPPKPVTSTPFATGRACARSPSGSPASRRRSIRVTACGRCCKWATPRRATTSLGSAGWGAVTAASTIASPRSSNASMSPGRTRWTSPAAPLPASGPRCAAMPTTAATSRWWPSRPGRRATTTRAMSFPWCSTRWARRWR